MSASTVKEFLRRDKVAGLITGTFGLAMFVFGAFSLVIIAFQRMMMSITPPPDHRADFEQFEEMMHGMHAIWITYMPFTIAGGVVFGVAGFFIYRGSLIARRIAQANTVLGIIWTIAYSITSYQFMQSTLMMPFYQKVPIYQNPVFQWGTIILNLIIMFAFPAAMLFILRRPKPTIEAK